MPANRCVEMHAHPNLRMRAYPDAVIAPVRPLRRRSADVPRPGVSFQSGVYDAGGGFVEDSRLSRSYRNVSHPGLFEPAAFCDEEVIYAGVWTRQFGHFVTEAVSRLWAIRERPDTRVVWSVSDGGRARRLPWQMDVLEVLGLGDESVILLNRATRFRSVVVPEPGFRIRDFFHPAHERFLARVRYEPQPGRKTWISRTAHEGARAVLEMGAFEDRLPDGGWTVIRPETLTVAEQLDHYRHSERIAGLLGSAFHTLMFLDDVERLVVDIFSRDGQDSGLFENYSTIATAKGFRQTIHADSGIRRCASDRSTSRYLAEPHKITQALDLANPATETDDPADPTRRMVGADSAQRPGCPKHMVGGREPSTMDTKQTADVMMPGMPSSRAKFIIDNPGDAIQRHHKAGRYYDMTMLRRHLELFPARSTILDVGANVGNHTIFYALCGRPEKILVFEPNPKANRLLRENVALNGIGSVDFTYADLAVGATTGSVIVSTQPERNLGATRFKIAESLSPIEVITLDQVTVQRCQFLKIDVEGMELDVLLGAKKFLRKHKPVVAIEVERKNNRSFWRIIQDLDYHVVDFKHNIPPFDYICVPKY